MGRIRSRGVCLTQWLGLLLVMQVALQSCGNSDSGSSGASQASAGAAAIGGSAGAPVAKPPVAQPKDETEAVLTDLFANYDKTLKADCECTVAMGAYKSIDECVMWQGSRPDWVPCIVGVLRDHEQSGVLEGFRCMQKELKGLAECRATKACTPEARAECEQNPVLCLTDYVDVAIEVGTRCPDITLLPRQ